MRGRGSAQAIAAALLLQLAIDSQTANANALTLVQECTLRLEPQRVSLYVGDTAVFRVFLRVRNSSGALVRADRFVATGGSVTESGVYRASRVGDFTVTASVRRAGCDASGTASVTVARRVPVVRSAPPARVDSAPVVRGPPPPRSRPRGATRSAPGPTENVNEELAGLQPVAESVFVAGLAARDSADYALVDVHFGTNRAATGNADPNEYFGVDRAPALAVGVARVSIPVNQHRPGNLERPGSFLWVTKKEDPKTHVMLQGLTLSTLDNWKASLRQGAAEQVLVFVHGYSNSFAEAARKAAQISYDLGVTDGITAMFSWPSQGTSRGYAADEGAVEASVPYLRDFLRALHDARPKAHINIICHSMGSRVVSAVLREFARDSTAPRYVNVVYAAADIDAQVFREQVLPEITGVASRITLYASANDKALLLSKEFHAWWRAGQSGDSLLVVDGVDTIDASLLDTGFLGHGYFAESKAVLDDLFMLLRRSLSPRERHLRAAMRGTRAYWVFP